MNRNQVTRDNESAASRKGAMVCAIAVIALLCGLFSKCEAQTWEYRNADGTRSVLDSIFLHYTSPGKIIEFIPKNSMVSNQPFDMFVYRSMDGDWEIQNYLDENGILFKAYLKVWRKDELVFSDSIFFATKK